MQLLPLLILSLFALFCTTPAVADDSGPDRPPNIVLIIGDDLGYPYAGFMGNEIVETPNLDRLAEEGITFTHAFSPASVCNPSLRTLMSGLHPRSWTSQRNRLEDAIGEPIPTNTEISYYVTLPRQLGRQGYRSFQGGKHWDGTFSMAGFDVGTTAVFPFRNPIVSPDWLIFARPSLSAMHDFLDGVEEDEPFFLHLAPMLPHTPHDPNSTLRARYEAMGLSNAAVLYYANITRFDEVLGRIVSILEARGLRDDTLIIYVSDNGWEQGAYDAPYFLGRYLGGDRGKLSLHDLGFRTPLIFNWPGRVPEDEVLDDLVTFEDLHATILQYAGAPIPPEHEGNSLIRRINGGGEPARNFVTSVVEAVRAREGEFTPLFFLTIETASYMRMDRWRYIEWLDRGEQALYDIEADPFERTDLSADHPEMLAYFAARTAAWREALDQPAPWMDLMGQLTAEDETPAAGLRLWLAGSDESGSAVQLEVFSNERGFFRFPNVPAGEYTLTYEIEAPVKTGRWRHVGTAPVTRNMEVDLVGYETGPFLSIQIPGEAPPPSANQGRAGTIEIQLLAHGGAETVGLPVHVRGWTVGGLVSQRVLSGPDGFVAVDQLPAGFYLIKVSAPRRVHTKSRWVYLRPGANEPVEISLWRKRHRKVMIYDSERRLP